MLSMANIPSRANKSSCIVDYEGSGSDLGTGGMRTKIAAAELATAAGCHTVVCLSQEPHLLLRIIEGEPFGTVFRARTVPMGDRKWWVQSVRVAGSLWIDDGAAKAVRDRKSLFAVGVVRVEGNFVPMNAVKIIAASDGREIGRGLVSYSAKETERIKGVKSSQIADVLGFPGAECVVHRDDMIIFGVESDAD